MYIEQASALYACLTLRDAAFCVCAPFNAQVLALVYIHECVFMLAEVEHVCVSVCVHL